MGNASKWKQPLIERTVSRRTKNLKQLVYGNPTLNSTTSIAGQDSSDGKESDEDGEFFRPKGEKKKKFGEGVDGNNVSAKDCSKLMYHVELKDRKSDELRSLLFSCQI